jgi:hypothetical protein
MQDQLSNLCHGKDDTPTIVLPATSTMGISVSSGLKWCDLVFAGCEFTFMRQIVVAAKKEGVRVPDVDEFYCDLVAPEMSSILRRIAVQLPSQSPSTTDPKRRNCTAETTSASRAFLDMEGIWRSR